MAISLIGMATSRKTAAGSLVESFIDNNQEDLSLNMINELEKLGEEIDELVEQELNERQDQIDSLTSEVEQLTDELEEINNGN
ncbi:hypothetical protein BK731_16840 [Bacillus thuringiensis serovar muju]|nr:hypothetical protein [Bacillus thuringiensis]MBH0346371.1 hypothetical protein [Bacillus thuringiensis]OTY05325.1 hypothetical protein BK731_16840 [Bacillus thuringiensis serovar muju]